MDATPYHVSFDVIIAAVAAGVPLLLVLRSPARGEGGLFWLRRRPPHLRGKGFLASIAPVLVFLWAVVLYGSFVEPHLLVTRDYAARIGEGSRTLRIAVISDMHLGYYKHEAWLARVVREVNAAKPDLVLLAGDLVSNAAGMQEFAPLAGLQSRFGTYAALGNWDYGVGAVDVRKAVESHAVEVLTNESVALDVDGATVRLLGLDDLWYGTPDWGKALADRKEGETTILLVHQPDFAQPAELHGIDLTIAGHTHGGQIRMPFIGPVPPLPTRLGRHYDQGLFPIGPSKLFITPGVGESGPRARLFNPPEVSILTVIF